MEYVSEFARAGGYPKIGLLVKKDNEKAKKIYSKMGFAFVKFYRKVIDGSVVEVWEREFAQNRAIA